MAATFERGDEDELGMSKERKKDCTEFKAKTTGQSPKARDLEDRSQEKFAVPFRPKNRRFDHIGANAAKIEQSLFHSLDGC